MLFGIFDAKAFEFNGFFFICTLLNEDDKGEREIGAYKPVGFLPHLQYKNVIFVSMQAY